MSKSNNNEHWETRTLLHHNFSNPPSLSTTLFLLFAACPSNFPIEDLPTAYTYCALLRGFRGNFALDEVHHTEEERPGAAIQASQPASLFQLEDRPPSDGGLTQCTFTVVYDTAAGANC